MKIFYISKLIRKMCRTIIRHPYVCHTPLTHRTSNRPPPDRLSDNCPVLLECPDEFIPNTNVARNGSTSTDTPLLCLFDTHDTSGLILPPPDTLSGNHPGAGNSPLG